jgi:hypothetical protein
MQVTALNQSSGQHQTGEQEATVDQARVASANHNAVCHAAAAAAEYQIGAAE